MKDVSQFTPETIRQFADMYDVDSEAHALFKQHADLLKDNQRLRTNVEKIEKIARRNRNEYGGTARAALQSIILITSPQMDTK